jgi:hypothetical protein
VASAKHLGERIREARSSAALSQAALAELADCTIETLARRNVVKVYRGRKPFKASLACSACRSAISSSLRRLGAR